MVDMANHEQAVKCTEIARAAMQANNLEKARRFADKAMKLHASDEINARTSSRGATPKPTANGHASAADVRQRPAAAQGAGRPILPERETDVSTPEQRELVRSIRRTKDFYEILSVSKDTSDEDIKRAYKKLALKLHPDKNKATGADEAFKKVSKAFSCLADPQKRAAYDRYGEDDGMQRRGSGMPHGFATPDDFDPNEIFNMFFGGGGFGGGFGRSHVFQTGFGGPPRRPRPQGQQQGPTGSFAGILHLLPILLLLFFTFMMQPSEPVFSLERSNVYLEEMVTRKFNVPFFVKSEHQFEQSYPSTSRERARVESEVETAFRESLEQNCYHERARRDNLLRWGRKEQAKNLPTPRLQPGTAAKRCLV